MLNSKRSIWSVLPILGGCFMVYYLVNNIIPYRATDLLKYNEVELYGSILSIFLTGFLCWHIRNRSFSIKLTKEEIEIKKLFSSTKKYSRTDIKNLTDNLSGKSSDGFYSLTFYIENTKYTISELYFSNYSELREEILKDYEVQTGIHSPLSIHTI